MNRGFSIPVEADLRGEAEGDDREGKQHTRNGSREDGIEAGKNEIDTGQAAFQNAGRKDDESRDRADDDGIHKNFERAPDALFDRMIDRSGGVGHRSTALTGFVRHHAAGDSALNRSGDH